MWEGIVHQRAHFDFIFEAEREIEIGGKEKGGPPVEYYSIRLLVQDIPRCPLPRERIERIQERVNEVKRFPVRRSIYFWIGKKKARV